MAMTATSPMSPFTPITLLYLLLIFTTPIPIISIPNISNLLSSYSDLSDFTNLLLSTAVAADIAQRSSLTLLAVPNSFLHSSTTSSSSPNIADILRYHVLLEYLSPADLRRFPAAGKLITTLFQTTGRATNNFGSVNITRNPTTNSITILSPSSPASSDATILALIKSVPYNITIYSVNSLLIPIGIDLMASESRPPLGLNITKALIDGHNFNVAASMLLASGVVNEFEADENGAGITLFIPTDESFSDLPPNARFQSLPADQKAVVLKFHVLHSYYPLGSLESIVNPVQPTLATEDMGAGSFTLNISRVNGTVAINSGIVQASVTQTVFDQKPVAIFGVSKVLLPREIFGNNQISTSKPNNGVMGGAEPPGISVSPETSPYGPSSQLSSPPVFQREIRSEATGDRSIERSIVRICCTVLLYVYVLV